MANKEYKDFTPGTYAGDQILPQQSTTDDTYTKVPVPTFGLGDNVAEQNRSFQTNGFATSIIATNDDAGDSKTSLEIENSSLDINCSDNDTGKSTELTVSRNNIVGAAGNSDFSEFTILQQQFDSFFTSYNNASLFVRKLLNSAGITLQTQDDEVSPTVQGIITQDDSETKILQHNTDDSAVAFASIKKDQINIKVDDTSNSNNIYADTENFTIFGTADSILEFYNSERRCYMRAQNYNLSSIQNFATNAAAITAGLQNGDVYRTAGVLMIVI